MRARLATLVRYSAIAVIGSISIAAISSLKKYNKELQEKGDKLKRKLKAEDGSVKETSTDKKFDLLNNLTTSIGAGTAIAYTTFPLEGYKKYLERNNKAPDEKFHPYRGSGIFALNIVPTTTIQFLTNSFLNTLLPEILRFLKQHSLRWLQG